MPAELLYPVFEELRRHGMELGVSDLQTAAEALQKGLFTELLEELPETDSSPAPPKPSPPARGSQRVKNWLRLKILGPDDEELATKTPRPRKARKYTDSDRIRCMLRLLWAKNPEEIALVDRAFLTAGPQFSEKASPSRSPERKETDGGTAGPDAGGAAETYELSQQGRRTKTGSEPTGGLAPRFSSSPDPIDSEFCLTPRPPVTIRRAVRSFRPLTRPVKTGLGNNPDIPALIRQICATGYLTDIQFAPRHQRLNAVQLLMDYGGSMIPFLPTLRPVVEALKSDRHRRIVRIGYFRNCPSNGIFQAPNLGNELKEDLFFRERAPLLIISDAGAARGYRSKRRIEGTVKFIDKTRKAGLRSVWLNPMPKDRWAGTSAGDILRRGGISMEPLNRQGLERAVIALRGGKGGA